METTNDRVSHVVKEEAVSRDLRGFASMDVARRREIASLGGRAAHAKGTAHEWSREQARIAGRKGGLARTRIAQANAQNNGQNHPAKKKEKEVA
jgi:general stress protein YciG